MSQNIAIINRLAYIQKLIEQELLNEEIVKSAEQLKASIDTASTAIQSVQLKEKDPIETPAVQTSSSLETPVVQTSSSLETPATDPKSETPDPKSETPSKSETPNPKSETPAKSETDKPIVSIQVDTRTDTSDIKVAASTPVSGPAPVPNKLSEYNFGAQKVDDRATDELKILLDMFNQSKSDKIELSKHLFNNTTGKEDEKIGKEFNNVFMTSKPKTVNYLESIVIDEYKPAFKNLKERIESLYVKFLLCFFLLKNSNKKSGLALSSDSTKQLSSIKEALTGLGGEGGEDVLKQKIKELTGYISSQEELLKKKENDLEQSKTAVEITNLQMILSKTQNKEMMDKFVEDAELFSFRVSVLLNITNNISRGIYEPDLNSMIESIKVSFTEPTPESDDPLVNQRNRLIEVQNKKINEICDTVLKISNAFQDSYLENKHLREEFKRYTEVANAKNFSQIQLLTDKIMKIQELEVRSRQLAGVIEDLNTRLKTSAVRGVVLASKLKTSEAKAANLAGKLATGPPGATPGATPGPTPGPTGPTTIDVFRKENETLRERMKVLEGQLVTTVEQGKAKDAEKAKLLKERDHIWTTFLQAKQADDESKQEIERIHQQLIILERGFEEAKAQLATATTEQVEQLVELSRRGGLIESLEEELERKNFEMSLNEQDQNAQIESLKAIQQKNDAEIVRLKKEMEGAQKGTVKGNEKELETMKKHIVRIAELTDVVLKVQESIYGKGRNEEAVEGLDLANRIKNEEVKTVLEGMISIFNTHPILLTIDSIAKADLEGMIRKSLDKSLEEMRKEFGTEIGQMEKVQAENDRLMTELSQVRKNEKAAVGSADKNKAALDRAIKEKEEAEKELARLRETTSAADTKADTKANPEEIAAITKERDEAQAKATAAQANAAISKEDKEAAQAALTAAEDKLKTVTQERDDALAKATAADAKATAAETKATAADAKAEGAEAKATGAEAERDAAITKATKALEEKEAALKSAQEAYAATTKAESSKSVSNAAKGALENEIQKLEKALTSAQELTKQKDAELENLKSQVGVAKAEAKLEVADAKATAADEAVKAAEESAELVGRAVEARRGVEAKLEDQIKEKQEAVAAAQRAEAVAKDALDAARASTIEVGVARGERNAAVAEVKRVKADFKRVLKELEKELNLSLAAQGGAQAQNVKLISQLSEMKQKNVELEKLNDTLSSQLAVIKVDEGSEVAKMLSVLHSTNDEKDKEQRKEITKLRGVVEAVGRIVSTRQSSQPRDIDHLLKEIDNVLTKPS